MNEPVSVRILDREYTVGVSDEERAGLASAARMLDARMRELHAHYPQYGFDRHKGYPTEEHRSALKKFGPCPLHRRTFQGVAWQGELFEC